MSNVLPTIPEFVKTPEEISAALRAVKLTLEVLAGMRQGESLGAPQVFVQGVEPSRAKVSTYKKGDFWINNTTSPAVLYYWTGTAWAQT